MRVFFLVQLLIVMMAGFVHAAFSQASGDELNTLLRERGEVYFSFEAPGKETLMELSRIISIDDIRAGEVMAYANEKTFTAFQAFSIPYKILTPPSTMHPAQMKSPEQLKGMEEWDFYPTYEAYVEMMYQFESDYPSICTVFSIGTSIDGRELLFARISDNITVKEEEPQFLYTSSMHGDETTGIVLTLRLIDYLLSNYGSDPEVNDLVDKLEIWINPMANPDGTYAGGNSSVNGATRYNANGVDLNRNYPDPEDGPHPDGNAWQQETLLFMQLAEDNQFVMGANIHGGAEVCNYPWDTWQEFHPDDDWWQLVCHEYADTAQANSPFGYMSGFDDGITNGYAWYTISGGRQDYMNYFHQCREFTLEISDTKLLPAFLLPDLWDYNHRSMINYMKQALYGLTGKVTDAVSGEPLYSEVFIEDHDADSSWVYTDGETGRYFRPLHAGTYDITFSATGYVTQTIEGISTDNGMLTELDVMLEGDILLADFAASETTIAAGNSIDFTDLSTGMPVSWEWTFEGGEPATSTDQHPLDIFYAETGIYDVTLTVTNAFGSNTLTKEDYIVVDQPSGNSVARSQELLLFPNPTSGQLKIKAPDRINTVSISSLEGKELINIQPGRNAITMSLESLPDGIYILILTTDNEVMTRKLHINK
jgi:PKD repeat protein